MTSVWATRSRAAYVGERICIGNGRMRLHPPVLNDQSSALGESRAPIASAATTNAAATRTASLTMYCASSVGPPAYRCPAERHPVQLKQLSEYLRVR